MVEFEIGQGCLGDKDSPRKPFMYYEVTKDTNSWKATREKGKIKITGKSFVDLYYNIKTDWTKNVPKSKGMVAIDCNNKAPDIWREIIKPMMDNFYEVNNVK